MDQPMRLQKKREKNIRLINIWREKNILDKNFRTRPDVPQKTNKNILNGK
jgi:hypothetical protein